MGVEKWQNPSQWSGWRGNLEESVAGMNGGGQELVGEREPDNRTPEEACWMTENAPMVVPSRRCRSGRFPQRNPHRVCHCRHRY